MDVKFCKFCNTHHPLTQEYWNLQYGELKICKIYHKFVHNKYKERDVENYKLKRKLWNSNNKEKNNDSKRSYVSRNKGKVCSSRQKWAEKNPNYHKEYRATRRKNDITFRISETIRSRCGNAVRGKKSGSSVTDLGCTIEELKQHLESKFQEGMSWDNWGVHGWHIDHIIPLSSFDLTDREQFVKACHYTNLQPLWAKDNLRKKDKIDWGRQC
jgi:hypothetical protein